MWEWADLVPALGRRSYYGRADNRAYGLNRAGGVWA
jgi:hypothetical protein